MNPRETSGSGRRLQFIDAARATAMLFVFVSHFADSYFHGGKDAPVYMRPFTLIASPTFLLISGTMIGFLWRTRQDFDRLRVRFIDRGLFLLTIGHLLITGPYLLRPHAGSFGATWHYLFTTDVIGVCMLIEPWLVTVIKPTRRVALSVAMFCASWIAVALWHPHTLLAEAVQETFFGSSTPVLYVYAFPLLPWFGLDLIGTVLGERLGELSLAGDDGAMLRLLWKVGAWSVLGGVALKIFFFAVRPFAGSSLILYAFTSPFAKNPPSLAYFLFYSGLGVGGILGGWLYLEQKGYSILNAAAAMGQTSLLMFITQSYVYYSGLYFLRPYLPGYLWPIWLAASILIVLGLSAIWYRMGLNRYVTVGYRYLQERRTLNAAQAGAAS